MAVVVLSNNHCSQCENFLVAIPLARRDFRLTSRNVTVEIPGTKQTLAARCAIVWATEWNGATDVFISTTITDLSLQVNHVQLAGTGV